MSQYRAGSVNVPTGSQTVFGVYDATVTGVAGTFGQDDPLSFQTTGASGTVTSWTVGTSKLKFTCPTSAQPAAGENVTTPTATGGVSVVNFTPLFLENIAAGDIFRPTTTGAVFQDIQSVPAQGTFTLGSVYTGPTLAESAYIVSTSFTTNFDLPFPEPGDQQPVATLKRFANEVDQTFLPVTASGHLQQQIDDLMLLVASG